MYSVVYLRDIATVSRGYVDPPERLAYFNGREAIILALTMRPGENVLDFGPRIVERARAIETTLPVGYRIGLATYQPEPVERAIDDVASSL
jgi:multidrug efflux pump